MSNLTNTNRHSPSPKHKSPAKKNKINLKELKNNTYKSLNKK